MEHVFLTGGRGNIGNAIKNKFEQEGYKVISPASHELDLLNMEQIASYVKEVPEVVAVIHCAGINNPVCFENIDFDIYLILI